MLRARKARWNSLRGSRRSSSELGPNRLRASVSMAGGSPRRWKAVRKWPKWAQVVSLVARRPSLHLWPHEPYINTPHVCLLRPRAYGHAILVRTSRKNTQTTALRIVAHITNNRCNRAGHHAHPHHSDEIHLPARSHSRKRPPPQNIRSIIPRFRRACSTRGAVKASAMLRLCCTLYC